MRSLYRGALNHATRPSWFLVDILFVLLTVANVAVVYEVLTNVMPYPIMVTWWQVGQSLLMAWILGEAGSEFSRLNYFPRVTLSKETVARVFIPSLAYLAMLVSSNLVLRRTPTLSAYPVLISLTVIVHHLARFVGFAEEYLKLRWKSIGILSVGFLLCMLDENAAGPGVLPAVFAAAGTSALFRAGFLQRLMHLVEGRGNILHNHQHLIGTILLLPVALFWGEGQAFSRFPADFTQLYNWQLLGCLFFVGFLPFARNVVSNRLIKQTGQGPWRTLELISIAAVAAFGLHKKTPGLTTIAAILLTLLGRGIGAVDVVLNTKQPPRPPTTPRNLDDPFLNEPNEDR